MSPNSQTAEDSVSWYQKALIGAVGGFALSLLKLIECQFYIGNPSSNEAWAGYLTYFSYLILGMIIAIFLTEHDIPVPKIRKNAFFLGFLAPSLLIAILTKPAEQHVDSSNILDKIPTIGALLVSNAYAQETEKNEAQDDKKKEPSIHLIKPDIGIKIISKADVEVKMSDAFRKALGRPKEYDKYIYVVAQTEDKTKAITTAGHIISVYYKGKPELAKDIEVIKFSNSSTYYLTIGGFGKYNFAVDTKYAATETATTVLKGEGVDQITIDGATLILKGAVVPGTLLYSHNPSN